MSASLIAVLVFALVTSAIVGLYLLMPGGHEARLRRKVKDRLDQITSGRGDEETTASDLIKTLAASPLPAVDRVAGQTSRGSALQRWIEQSGVRISISSVLVMATGLGIVFALVAGMLARPSWVPLVGGIVGFLVPFAVVRQRRSARLRKFEEQFPEALDLISRAVRAGHAFSSGLKMVADEVDDPVGREFRKTFDEQNFGLPLKDSLNNLADRVPLLDVRFFDPAVLIQRETGGNLAEILDNLAHVVRERFKILRQVRVHTAHGRLTGYVLLALPACLVVALMFINPDHMNLLFRERMGQYMILFAIVMQIIGYVWIKQVVKIEV